MKIPLKPSRLELRRTKVKWIIIHHTSEIYPAPSASIDNPKYQMPGIMGNVLEKSDADINYHYVIDKIKEDYMPIICRPFVALCDWPDIDPNINKAAIHIAGIGSYDFKIPERRFYEILAYRVVSPMMKLFSLPTSKIILHSEVSDNKELTCPGEFFDKAVLISMLKRFIMK